MALRLLVVVVLLTTTCELTQGELVMPGVRRMERSDIFFPTDIVFPTHPPSSNHREAVRPQVAPAVFPADVDEALELPEDINMLDLTNLHRLNSLTNISDFASFFSLELPPETVEVLDINTRFGGGAAPEAVEMAKMANCKPELVTVTLDLPTESNTVYFPTCVRVEQCGGCCYGPLLTCRPTVTKVVRFKVVKAQVGGDDSTVSSTRSSGSERRRRPTRRRRRQSSTSFHEVEVVKHTTCVCGCKVQEQDCNSAIHTYFEGECACQCKNRDEKVKCEKDSSKYWDNDTCSCFCRNTRNCSSGEFFSHTSCRCELVSARSGLGVSAGGADTEPSTLVNIRTRTPPNRRRKPVRVPLN